MHMLDPILTEWASMIIRWLHVVAGVAWIGSSFYFVHLDLSLKQHDGLGAGIQGDAWQVHGGGFYHMIKYLVAPARMPDEVTWFKWEAYTTWLSGFALLVLVYYLDADLFLIDKSVLERSPLGRYHVALALVGYVFLVALTLAFTQVFAGRGAFVQIGALIGTIMVANVFVVIIPYQKKSVAALLAGQTPDPKWSKAGKQRSVHNNYLTLPVVFLMLSNHYPLIFATRYNWIIVAIILALGPLIRHFYNARHAGLGNPWWTWIVAAAGMLLIAWLSTAGPRQTVIGNAARGVNVAAAEEIVTSRCSMCHGADPVWTGIAAAPGGVMLDTPERIRQHARLIDIYAVRSNAMPPGNLTEMTLQERQIVGAWIEAGAPAH
jgi:uncharacterized membrane protein